MTIKSIVICGATVFTLTALIAGCSHSPSSSATQSAAASHACESNPYMMKYNCSITKIQAAAENGSADAQYALGYMYYYGIGTVRDQQTAELWIERSAAQGQPLAKKAWSLINSGATFTDLHQAAAGNDYTAPYDSRSASTIVQQEPADIDNMNKTVPTEPITKHLPAYHMPTQSSQNIPGGLTSGTSSETTSETTAAASPPIAQEHHAISDPRLSPNAKPRIASAQPKSNASADMSVLIPSSPQQTNPTVATNQKYTVQLLASNKLSDLKSFVAVHNLGNKAAYFETKLDGKPWFMLTYGQYNSAVQAELALQNLPKSLQHHQPWVKSLAIVHQEVKQQKVIA
ncbi:MAG TPA: SPOR domain-containing protein [Coxiellaceae bacterium]|nr:MAG: hypothetical protein A3E81_05960 [Gammaproteobacteria bacterium RIFCSPHIGHO2_12_FULL_36_30]HLB56908.1 SPOR domain-containing protein [Coxiellaceae bacterium]